MRFGTMVVPMIVMGMATFTMIVVVGAAATEGDCQNQAKGEKG